MIANQSFRVFELVVPVRKRARLERVRLETLSPPLVHRVCGLT